MVQRWLPKARWLHSRLRYHQHSSVNKSVLHAAKAMAVTAAQLIDDPALLAQAKVEFETLTDGSTYKAAIPDGSAPPKPHLRS